MRMSRPPGNRLTVEGGTHVPSFQVLDYKGAIYTALPSILKVEH